MLDYIFFDPSLSDKFKDHLTKVGIEFECEDDEGFGSVQGEIVSIDDETSDKTLDELQDLYDDLQDELEALLEQSGDALIMNAAGMEVKLKDGNICTLRVSPDIVTRILTVLDFDELQAFIDNIARSVEEPDSGQFCHNINKD
jgi:molybdopterin converting factor small subunit